MKRRGHVRKTDHYRIFYTHRPQAPNVLKYIDPEFEAIYINTAAAPGARVVWLRQVNRNTSCTD